MSRSTAEIVADLRAGWNCALEAADRLTELDADLVATRADALEALDLLDLRPDCSRGCDNGVFHEERAHSGGDIADVIVGTCPENGGNCDGKVSIEQLAATWRAVHGRPVVDGLRSHSAGSLLDHLRAVRP